MKSFLALDLGTKTGWALASLNHAGNLQIQSGVQSFVFNPRYEGGGMRFLKFQRWMDEMNRGGVIERLVFEEVMQRPASVAAGHVYGGFLGHLTSWCEQNNIPYEGVPVGTVKKDLTGRGNATKKDMIEWIKLKGHAPADDNEADALAVLYWLLKNATPNSDVQRSAPDIPARRRVPMVTVPVAGKDDQRTQHQDGAVPGRSDRLKRSSPGVTDKPAGRRGRRAVLVGR